MLYMKKNNKVMNRRAFIFDFDGTLIDTMDTYADIASNVINHFHPEINIDEARKKYLETSGLPFFQQLDLILPLDRTNSVKANIFERKKKKHFFDHQFSDKVIETINSLKKRGDFVCISSNNNHELIEDFILKSNLKFDIVLGFKQNFAKGEDHFNFIMNKLKLKKNEIVFVGDSLEDAKKAIDFKILFVGICGTFKKNDFLNLKNDFKIIESITEILNF